MSASTTNPLPDEPVTVVVAVQPLDTPVVAAAAPTMSPTQKESPTGTAVFASEHIGPIEHVGPTEHVEPIEHVDEPTEHVDEHTENVEEPIEHVDEPTENVDEPAMEEPEKSPQTATKKQTKWPNVPLDKGLYEQFEAAFEYMRTMFPGLEDFPAIDWDTGHDDHPASDWDTGHDDHPASDWDTGHDDYPTSAWDTDHDVDYPAGGWDPDHVDYPAGGTYHDDTPQQVQDYRRLLYTAPGTGPPMMYPPYRTTWDGGA
ncbi:uncharacterized protein H6S33_007491 [Morchella sextelata]|uniref:uncharacterized protein n=1 Tax=Morchella sextelata TaxID=1174677 RepID=UPI001D053547|nr:uncharacterized protein H6S33_007491 [Morchella sextelata]KAH0603832.1 hypothetical protein H6S33_007491 [Morchella sextelata]